MFYEPAAFYEPPPQPVTSPLQESFSCFMTHLMQQDHPLQDAPRKAKRGAKAHPAQRQKAASNPRRLDNANSKHQKVHRAKGGTTKPGDVKRHCFRLAWTRCTDTTKRRLRERLQQSFSGVDAETWCPPAKMNQEDMCKMEEAFVQVDPSFYQAAGQVSAVLDIMVKWERAEDGANVAWLKAQTEEVNGGIEMVRAQIMVQFGSVLIQ